MLKYPLFLHYVFCGVKAALSNTDLPKVEVVSSTATDEEPELDVNDEDTTPLDTSSVPTIITLTKVSSLPPIFL